MLGAIIGAIWLLCILGIPVLSVLSLQEWASSYRRTLPAVRSRIGIASLGVIFFGWFFLAALTVIVLIHDAWMDFFTVHRNIGFLLLAVTASILSLTLKGSARVLAMAAGMLLVLFALLWLLRDMP